MRIRIALGLFIIFTVPAFVGGMYFAQWLLTERPAAPVPVLLPERPAPQPYTLPLQYASTVIYWCDQTGVPIWIASRLFAWESGFAPAYHSRRNENGSYDDGIAALNSYSLTYFSIRFNQGMEIDPHDAETSIKIGICYLAELYQETGSWAGAVSAYNVGINGWKAGVRPVRHLKAVLGS